MVQQRHGVTKHLKALAKGRGPVAAVGSLASEEDPDGPN